MCARLPEANYTLAVRSEPKFDTVEILERFDERGFPCGVHSEPTAVSGVFILVRGVCVGVAETEVRLPVAGSGTSDTSIQRASGSSMGLREGQAKGGGRCGSPSQACP